MPSTPTKPPVPFIEQVRIRNYKSIGECAVELHPLTVLVGRNGSGKSNFLDALRFISDALETSLDHAFKSRGGIDLVRRRSTGHPRNFAIRVHARIDAETTAVYGFEIGAKPRGGFFVKDERLRVDRHGQAIAHYQVNEGRVESSSPRDMPPAASDRLYLVTASSREEFRSVYNNLRAMGFYNLNPAAMMEPQSPDAGELLHRDGSNIASVVGRLEADQPDSLYRVQEYLSRITPGIDGIERVTVGPRETLQFRQKVVGAEHPWRFYAANMSDGTLRAAGVLVAVSQLVGRDQPVRLVGIEEPEVALHPAAAGALLGALLEANASTQVIVTTHSADLLDIEGLDPRSILLVVCEEGETRVGPIDKASLDAVRGHMYSLGELHRMDQLFLDRGVYEVGSQVPLFEGNRA